MDTENHDREFIHTFIAANKKKTERGKRQDKVVPTLLVLHGTGGNEQDLIPLARQISSEAAILSPRGKVLENGIMPKFFRRLAEGVFDIEDLKFLTNELADFVVDASEMYGFDLRHVTAVGYSNGANIAASMLLLRPEILSSAILFSAMVPFVPETFPNLSTEQIFISSGQFYPIVIRGEAKRLFGLLKNAGAMVSLNWQGSGHELTIAEIRKARDWLLQSTSSYASIA